MNQDRTRRLLLPIDGSQHAQRAADYLATCAGSMHLGAIYVLNVQSADEQAAFAAENEGDAVDYEKRGIQATARARAVLDAAKLPNSVRTLLGDPASVIVRTAEEEEVDEIVMGSRSKDHLMDVIGSVAYKVVHHVRVPVTIVPALRSELQRKAPGGDTHRVLLAVDGSEHSARAVDLVCGMNTASPPVEVVLLYVTSPMPAAYVRGVLSEDLVESSFREERDRVIEGASRALSSAGLKFTTHVLPGDAAQKIVETANNLGCTRIVMGTRGLGTVAGLVLGSCAYKVLHLSSIPVTLVK
jgi:nucleotide-binding universal stress UspA family protein